MIDRQARDRMASALRSYMDERSTAFALDDARRETMSATGDETVHRVGESLWYFYDDVQDHRVVAVKEEWDCFNRLLLLLESDAELVVERGRRRWGYRQGIAGICLMAFSLVVVRTGWGDHLLIYAMPFGVVSMVLAWLDERAWWKATSALESATVPFPSIGSLLAVRRSVVGFTRRRYPPAVAGRRIRDPFIGRIMWALWGLMWLMFAPVLLLLQVMPYRERSRFLTKAGTNSASRRGSN